LISDFPGSEVHWLVSDVLAGDHLFFLFSGHGGQKEDQNGDEEDGYDETILPCDHRTAGIIIDDDLHDWLVKRIPVGAKLTALMDCCHSGTGLDLPFVHSVGYDGRISTQDSYASHSSSSSSSSKKKKKHHKQPALQLQQQVHTKMSWGDVTLFSGCRDDQTSSDASRYGLKKKKASTSSKMRENDHLPFTALGQCHKERCVMHF